MSEPLGPERPGGQGLDNAQEESGNRAILALLTDAAVADHVDLVITHRDDAYEVWTRRGMVRFERRLGPTGLTFPIVEQPSPSPAPASAPACTRAPRATSTPRRPCAA